MKTLAPGSVIGMLGGGQLGRMIAMAAAQLGFHTHIYCPYDKNPGEQVTDKLTRESYTDFDALQKFIDSVDVVTYEFENIPLETVEYLTERATLFPSAKALQVSQDRLTEKDFLNNIGLTTAPYAAVSTAAQAAAALEKITYPAVLNNRRFGYDGKGQVIVRERSEVIEAFNSLGSDQVIIEGFINFDLEISVIAARGQDGEIKTFIPFENQHKNHILDISITPPRIEGGLIKEACAIAQKIVSEIDYVGILTAELFVSSEEPKLIVNEIAPRVHNSGHLTIEACPTSQFEQHVRAICGLPLGSTQLYGQAVMTNLIGDDIFNMNKLLSDPKANVHHYGKSEARAGRKMGHVTRLYAFDEGLPL
jgi:5-(carboxyamino)imidazole ribonucleotide synthase